MADKARAVALQRWLAEEHRRRTAAEAAFQQTSVESAGRSDALYLASYLVESSIELAELVGLDSSTIRGLILRSAERERDMPVYRAAFEALGLPLPEREYGLKLARKLLAEADRAGAQDGAVAEALGLAQYRLSGSETVTRRRVELPLDADDQTLAEAALGLGVQPERLENAGRDSAADLLRSMLAEAAGVAPGGRGEAVAARDADSAAVTGEVTEDVASEAAVPVQDRMTGGRGRRRRGR